MYCKDGYYERVYKIVLVPVSTLHVRMATMHERVYKIVLVLVSTLHVRMATMHERVYKIVLVLAKRRGGEQNLGDPKSQRFFTYKVHLKLWLRTLGGNVLFPLRITLSVKCIGVQQNNIITVQPIK